MTLLLLLGLVAGLTEEYQAGEYETVVAHVPTALAAARTGSDSVDVLRLQAFALVALGRNREAAATFGRLLDLAPQTVLDPGQVSPKIRAVFEQVRASRPTQPVEVRTDTVRLDQPVSLSVLVPGLDQVRNDRRVKGYLLMGGAAVSLAGLVGSHVMYQQARDEYLNTTDLHEIQNRYDDANRWYQTRTILIGTATLVWVYNLVDALFHL